MSVFFPKERKCRDKNGVKSVLLNTEHVCILGYRKNLLHLIKAKALLDFSVGETAIAIGLVPSLVSQFCHKMQ